MRFLSRVWGLHHLNFQGSQAKFEGSLHWNTLPIIQFWGLHWALRQNFTTAPFHFQGPRVLTSEPPRAPILILTQGLLTGYREPTWCHWQKTDCQKQWCDQLWQSWHQKKFFFSVFGTVIRMCKVRTHIYMRLLILPLLQQDYSRITLSIPRLWMPWMLWCPITCENSTHIGHILVSVILWLRRGYVSHL